MEAVDVGRVAAASLGVNRDIRYGDHPWIRSKLKPYTITHRQSGGWHYMDTVCGPERTVWEFIDEDDYR